MENEHCTHRCFKDPDLRLKRLALVCKAVITKTSQTSNKLCTLSLVHSKLQYDTVDSKASPSCPPAQPSPKDRERIPSLLSGARRSFCEREKRFEAVISDLHHAITKCLKKYKAQCESLSCEMFLHISMTKRDILSLIHRRKFIQRR